MLSESLYNRGGREHGRCVELKDFYLSILSNPDINRVVSLWIELCEIIVYLPDYFFYLRRDISNMVINNSSSGVYICGHDAILRDA